MSANDPAAAAEAPPSAAWAASDNPQLWAAYRALGEAASAAGPLEARARRLVHLALAIAAGSEGATHSHARRALEEGVSAEEAEHVALLAVTTLGWPRAMQGLSWVRDVTRGDPRPHS